MSKDGSKRPSRHVGSEFPGHGHDTTLGGVPELPMAAAQAYLSPAVPLEQPDQIPDFHRTPFSAQLGLCCGFTPFM